jgi:hypothetical protein
MSLIFIKQITKAMKNSKKLMKKIIRQLLATLLVLSLPFILYGQNEESIISLSAEKEFYLTTDETNRLMNIRENILHKSVYFIEIGNIPETARANNGALPFKLPHRRRPYIALPTSVEFVDDTTNFVWRGKFKESDGQVMLIHLDGEVFGEIRVDGKLFEIQSFRKGKNIMVEFDEKELAKPFDNLHIKPPTEENEIDGEVTIKSSGKPLVRILILYTDNAFNRVANIQNNAYVCGAHISTAIMNSGLYDDLLVERTGNAVRLAFTETSNPEDDLVRLALNTPEARDLRNYHEADLVVLLTHGVNYGDYLGASFVGPNENYAYAIVQVDHATSKYVFAHEVGHLFGGRHDDDQLGTYNRARVFSTWYLKYYHTIVARGDAPGTRILYFSNPDVYYDGLKTGTSTRNNARKIRETAPIVKAFRPYTPPPPPLSVYITGPYEGYNGYFYTWYSHVSNGVAPYSYQWYHGTSNFGPWTPYQQGGTSANLTAQLPWDNNLYLRLRVTSFDNQTAYAHFDTWNNGTLGQMQEKSLIETNIDEQFPEEQIGMEMMEAELHLNISPNPVRDVATLDYYVIQKGLVRLELFDINGIKINDLLNEDKDEGFYTFTFNVQNLTKGVYICKLSVGKEQVSKMLIIE